MTGENPFGGFDEDWKNTPEAAKGGGLGRVPPAVYKCMLTTVDPGDGRNPIDHDVIDRREQGGSLGLKLFLEVISPEKVKNPQTGEEEATKGKIIEHMWWITSNTLAYIKRDVKTIIGREIAKASELAGVQWAGHTVEVGVRDEEYNGYVNSRIYFWNKWDPKAGQPQAPAPGKAASAPGGKKAASPAPTAGPGIRF